MTPNSTRTSTPTPTPTPTATATSTPTPTSTSTAALAAVALLLAGCERAELLHALGEAQANQVLLALDEGGVAAEKRRDPLAEGAWVVEVGAGEASRARRLLSERELPRPPAAGLAEAYGKGSLVPTPAEERARFLLAVAGELSRTVEGIDGVVEARVHLALPPDEPLRLSPPAAPRGAVLVKVRAGARGQVEPLAPGIQALVAGAVNGLEPGQVAVVLAEIAQPPAPVARRAAPRPLYLALGLGASTTAFLLLLAGIGVRLPRLPLLSGRRRGTA
jgi:type III secretion protein J